MNKEQSKEIMARNIKKYMERKGVSNQQLCDALDFKYTTFMDWIKGVTYPRIDKIEKLANYFGVLKSDLIEEKSIDSHPVEMAQIHYEIIMDEDISEIFADFKKLDAKQKKIVKNLIHDMAESEA